MKKAAKILIVDDTELNREVLEGLVAALGHTPIVVDNGRDALDILKKGPIPDLILLDILMPEVSGFDVLQKVKSDENLRSLPVIMISIVDEMESIVKCIELGADDFMVKPFNVILLKARINACLERKDYEDKQKQFSFWLANSYQKLQKAEQVRDEMFNMIVHDMNNSLVTLLGETDLLLESGRRDLSHETLVSLQNIAVAGKQIQGMVGGILDISKMEKGQVEPKLTSVNINELVSTTAKQYEKAISHNNGRLSTIFTEHGIVGTLDGPLLQRILQNILTNVLKHGMSNAAPEVTISVSSEMESFDIIVADNGDGIPVAQLDKVFRKYYKIKPHEKGLGLGLAFCKMATEAMGGSIMAGPSPSGGAQFRLTFKKR